MPPLHVEIVGMTCSHCVSAVQKRLASLPGVTVDDVQVGFADIRLDDTKSSIRDIEEAVSDEGYTVDEVKERSA